MSKIVTLLLVLIFLTVSCVITFFPVQAEGRTIVVPDDYPTIHEAIRNANAGDTVFVKKGTYEGPTYQTLVINKVISLIGEDPKSTKIILHPPVHIEGPNAIGQYWSWYGPAITVDANDFKLLGLTINSTVGVHKAGGAISITGNRTQIVGNHIIARLSVNGSNSEIADNTLMDDVTMLGSNSTFAENDFSGGAWLFGSYLNISGNNKALSNKVGTMDSGIRLTGSFCLVYGNVLTAKDLDPGIGVGGDGNIVVGNVLDQSDTGMAIAGSNNLIYANRITNCKDNAFIPGYPPPTSGVAIRSSGSNSFYANYVADNTWGADVNAFPENNLTSTFYNNNFVNNLHQVSAISGWPYGLDNFDSGQEGNYWSDYDGTDTDGDGIGEAPYVIDDNRMDRYPLVAPFDIESVSIDLSDWMSPPTVNLVSPKNTTYTSANIVLEFTVSKQVSWMGYSLDGRSNVTMVGNTTLPNLAYGSHDITVYAIDMVGMNGASETIYLTVTEPFPTTLVISSVITVVGVGLGLFIYFKKRKR